MLRNQTLFLWIQYYCVERKIVWERDYVLRERNLTTQIFVAPALILVSFTFTTVVIFI